MEFSDTSHNRPPPPKPIVLRSLVDVDLCSLVFDLCRELVSSLEKIRSCFVIPDTYKFRVHGIFGHEP